MASASQPFTNDADLAQHMRSYRAALDLHAKLVIVSHSQGNFYANAAYAALASEKPEYGAATGVVGVASPASTVAGVVDGGPYTTFSEDWVINAVRYFYPNTLPANATTGTTPVDGLGHGFQTAYLAVADARATILRNVVQVESGLVPVPKPETGTDPACLPPLVVQNPADCAAALENSCVDKFFGSCWDPSGSCSIVTSTTPAPANLIAVGAPAWSNGARINMAADVANLDAPKIVVSVVGSTGQVCATGVSQSGGGACLVEAIHQARAKNLSICAHEDGTAELTCPDGTVIDLPTANCAFSKTNAANCQ